MPFRQASPAAKLGEMANLPWRWFLGGVNLKTLFRADFSEGTHVPRVWLLAVAGPGTPVAKRVFSSGNMQWRPTLRVGARAHCSPGVARHAFREFLP